VKAPRAVGVIPLGGGMTIGLERAGFDTVLSMEMDEAWTANIRLNRPDVPQVTGLEEWEAYAESMREDPPELVYGSPPCQGVTGASATASADNPKNEWVIHFARAALTIGPRFALWENIPRMLSIGRPIVTRVEEMCRAEGYTLSAHVHEVGDFGVCQRRKRVMFVMERKGKGIAWPSHPHLRAPTVWETVSDLAEMETYDEDEGGLDDGEVPVFPYEGAPHNDHQAALRHPEGFTWNHDRSSMPDRFAALPPGKVWIFDMPDEALSEKELDRKRRGAVFNAHELHRLHPDRVARTLTGARNKLHPTQNRIVSVREASRLMSFPDSWRWAHERNFQQMAAGVCPPVCEWFGAVMMAELAGTPLPALEGRLF